MRKVIFLPKKYAKKGPFLPETQVCLMRASKTALLALFSILRSQLYDDQFGRLKQLLAVRF